MTPIPIASFLAGSLLTILLPLAVLMALVVWYFLFLRRVPDPAPRASRTDASGPPSAATPTEEPGAGDGGQQATRG